MVVKYLQKKIEEKQEKEDTLDADKIKFLQKNSSDNT